MKTLLFLVVSVCFSCHLYSQQCINWSVLNWNYNYKIHNKAYIDNQNRYCLLSNEVIEKYNQEGMLVDSILIPQSQYHVIYQDMVCFEEDNNGNIHGALDQIIMFDSLSNISWVHYLRNTLGDTIKASSAINSGSGFWTITTDNMLNSYTTGSFNKANSSVEGFIIDNDTIILTNNGIYPFFAKFDVNGELQWVKLLFDDMSAKAIDVIKTDNEGNVYLCGGFQDYIQFHNGPMLSSSGFSDGFIAKYTSGGQLIWAKKIADGAGPAGISGIDISRDRNIIYLFGYTTHVNTIMNFDAISFASPDFITRIDTSGNVVWAIPISLPDVTNWHSIREIAVGSNDNLFVSGQFDGANGLIIDGTTYNFEGGPYTYGIPHENGIAFYVFSLKENGQVDWFINGANDGFDLNNDQSMAVNSSNEVILFDADRQWHPLLHCNFPQNGVGEDNGEPTVVASNVIFKVGHDNEPLILESVADTSLKCGDSIFVDINSNMCIFNSVTWIPSIGVAENSLQTMISPDTTTIYKVIAEDRCGRTDSVSFKVTVNSSAQFSYTTNGYDASFVIDDISCTTFLWDFGNGNTSNLVNDPVLTYDTDSIYTVCLQCNNQSSLRCGVSCIQVEIPSNMSGGTGFGDVLQVESPRYFPNPSNGLINIKWNYQTERNSIIRVYNAFGAEIYYENLKNNFIDLSNYPKGVYFIKFTSEKNNYVSKIILN